MPPRRCEPPASSSCGASSSTARRSSSSSSSPTCPTTTRPTPSSWSAARASGPATTTCEALDAFVERRIEGFGEEFRHMLRHEMEFGAHSWLSRATAGVYNQCLVFAMTGRVPDVQRAMQTHHRADAVRRRRARDRADAPRAAQGLRSRGRDARRSTRGEAADASCPTHDGDVWMLDVPGDDAATPVLVLHGFPSSAFDFAEAIDCIARRRRVVALDFPGFGLSCKPARPRLLALRADRRRCSRSSRTVGSSRAHVWAHDMGTSVATELLARRERQPSVRSNLRA